MHEGFRVSAVDACQMSAEAATRGMLYVAIVGETRQLFSKKPKTERQLILTANDESGIHSCRRLNASVRTRVRARARACAAAACASGGKSFVDLSKPRKYRARGKVCVIVGIKGRIKGIVMSPAAT